MPEVTVLMSAYNEAPAILREAVLSILKQTYEDFEFIIVNDNPENGELAEALLSLSVEDPRIAIVQNELARNARSLYERSFSPSAHREAWLRILRQVYGEE